MAVPGSYEHTSDVSASASLDEGQLAEGPNVESLMNQLSLHHHTPLSTSTKCVRLLEVLPGPGYEPIKCRLSQHSLDDDPSYIALSYTWEQGRKRHIECDGMRLEIGDNLWHFFSEFRRRRVLQEHDDKEWQNDIGCLWIDAVCIDQSNLEERNQQVAQMREIYTNAKSVIVWLGLAQSHEELAFLLTKYPDLLEHNTLQNALLRLLSKPYFTRVWVVQEFILARSVDFWCGQLSADSVALDKIWHEDQPLTGLPELSKAIQRTPAWPLFVYRRMFRNKNSGQQGLEDFRLRNLLFSFSSSQSSEVYDTIYGFLGIASDETKTACPIHPDYSKPAVELLADVLRNQCWQQATSGSEDDHDLLAFLLSRLRVSRIEFARYLMQDAHHAEEHLFVLTVSDFVVVSLCLVNQIAFVGSYEHISELSLEQSKTALLRSSIRRHRLPGTKIPRFLSNADIRALSSAIAEPETVTGLELKSFGRGGSALHDLIQNSTNKLLLGLSHPCCEQTSAMQQQELASAELNTFRKDAEIRQMLSRSLSNASETYRTEHRVATMQERKYRHGKYAAFIAKDNKSLGNNMIGVLCNESNFGNGPMGDDEICVFAAGIASNKALIMERKTTDAYVVKGSAIIITPNPKPGPEGIVQSFQRLLRKGETPRTKPRTSVSAEVKIPIEKVCFHCSLADILELIRCGIVNEAQIDHILEQSFTGDSQDQVHKCKLGTGQLPSLEFAM